MKSTHRYWIPQWHNKSDVCESIQTLQAIKMMMMMQEVSGCLQIEGCVKL